MKVREMIMILMGAGILFLQCSTSTPQVSVENAAFQLLKKNSTGLEFENVLKQTKDFNVFSYMYFFNGGGVVAGDFNQDGLDDLFFTSNMGPNALFLNEGDLKFREVTDQAGLAGQEGWTSGASLVDINNDGLLDIYVSQIGEYSILKGTNQLYICQGIENGIPVFRDMAPDYGLDLAGFATQASFFDYDLDGDLDMFQLNHTLHQNGTFGRRKEFVNESHNLAGDRLMRNDSEGDKILFTDVTAEAGIYSTVIGYGLGIVTGDINLDGWPDLYIGNDFHENDYLYINQKDGTFRESINDYVMHTSRFSMGVDMADINNDGWSEIMTLDMLPFDPYVLKTSLGEDGYDIFQFKIGHGYNHQYARNNLQLNNGNGTFSEIGMYSGVYATDWSWATLFMDFDYDGYRDIFVSNGIPRRMNDIDYVNFRLGDPDIKFKTDNNQLAEEELSIVETMPHIKIANKFFHNNGDLTFTDMDGHIAGNQPTYSHGAVYADLDNDGDLDIVVNNIEDEPFVYKNLTINGENPASGKDFYSFKFRGSPENILAIGAKIVVKKKDQQLIYEHYPVRGYQSSVAPGLHIGIGNVKEVEEVIVIWPDNTWEAVNEVTANTTHTLTWKEGLPVFDYETLRKKASGPFSFTNQTSNTKLEVKHEENPFVEFNREVLMPHMVSSEGPALAVADVNGDGLEDVFVGSAKRKRSSLWLQTPGGTFREATPESIRTDSMFEDVDAAFADIDNDGDQDLLIAAGGNEYRGEAEQLKQRAFINDGRGRFERKDLFEGAFVTASCILPADFDGDGWVDVFIGGRAVTSNYGEIPDSYLYKNKGDGTFSLVTEQYSPELKQAGLVKDGAWQDMDLDGDPDLVLAVEWEPVQIFENQGNSFVKKEINELKGWWNFVLPADLDQDGDMDILAGNLGENSRLRPTREEPVRMYVEDFDDNGKTEQILTYYLGGKEVPFANHAELTRQLVSLKKEYLYAKDLASASMNEIFGGAKLESSAVFEVNYLKSAWFENDGQGEYKVHALPGEAQFSTLETACLADLNQDGENEVITAGNFYECNIEMGRYDAGFGNILTQFGENGPRVSPLVNAPVKGQTRRIKAITISGKKCFLFARNDNELEIICLDNEVLP